MHNNYQIRINQQGHKTLHKIGEHNLQAEIQAEAEENEIGNILKRYEGGDIEALNKAKAGYVDLTQCPKDLREAQDTVLKLREEFNSLPVETRRKFDHSPEKYISEYGNPFWLDAMEIKEPAKSTVETPKETEKGADTNE